MSHKKYNENFMSPKNQSSNPIQTKSTMKTTYKVASEQIKNQFIFEQDPHSFKNIQISKENIIELSIAPMKLNNKQEEKDRFKNHGDMNTTEETGSLEELSYDQSKNKDAPDEKENENTKQGGLSEDSSMSVLRFCSFILQISALDSTNYRALEMTLAMDTSSEESIIQAALDYCQDTP